MFRRQRTGRTRWVVAAVAALALLGGGLVAALPASAAVAVTDGFEGNGYDRWTVDEARSRSLVELGQHQSARTGANVAWLDAYPPSASAARIYSTISLDDPGGCCGSWCYGTAYLLRALIGPIGPDGKQQEARPELPRVSLQVRAGGPAGAFISGASYDLPANQTAWGRASFASFPYQSGPLTVDISVRSGTVKVDDVSVSCQREIH